MRSFLYCLVILLCSQCFLGCPPLRNSGTSVPASPKNLFVPRTGKLWPTGLTFAMDEQYYRHIFSRISTPLGVEDLDMNIDGRPAIRLRRNPDGEIYFAQGFVTRFKPQEVQSLSSAMTFLGQSVQYEPDLSALGGSDVWQTGAGTVRRGRGDCEDHAILLTGMLITLGYDARVVLGNWRGAGYHAWVVYPDSSGKFRVIESTSKASGGRELEVSEWDGVYIPELMLNDKFLWELAGGKGGDRLSDWRVVSRFEEMS